MGDHLAIVAISRSYFEFSERFLENIEPEAEPVPYCTPPPKYGGRPGGTRNVGPQPGDGPRPDPQLDGRVG